MKILYVSRRYWPDVIGGGQISAHQIAKGMVKAGHDVRVLTFHDKPRKDEILDGVKITRVPIRKLKLFRRFSNLEWMYREMKLKTLSFLKEFKPDVMHALNSESIPSIGAVSRKTGIPFVATINGPTPFCFIQQGNDSRGNNCFGCKGWRRFSETMLTWGNKGVISKVSAFLFWIYSYPHMRVYEKGARTAKFLLPVSKDIKRRLMKMGYEEEKLRVIHNPIAVNKKVNSNVKKKLGIKPTEKVLLFAGRVTESKGVQNMVLALSKLPRHHIVVAGKGDFIGKIQELAKFIGVSKRVHFVGFVANEKLNQYYSIADVVIMAGTFYESLGRMLLEACSFGVPIIATDSAGNPDIIENGKNGFLLKTQDPAELAQRIKEIKPKTMGKYAQNKIQREFSPKKVSEALYGAYKDESTIILK